MADSTSGRVTLPSSRLLGTGPDAFGPEPGVILRPAKDQISPGNQPAKQVRAAFFGGIYKCIFVRNIFTPQERKEKKRKKG